MRIFVPKETTPGERRAAIVPATAKRFVELGAEVRIESGLGVFIYCSDAEYESAGAHVIVDRTAGLREADAVLRLQKPPADEIGQLRANSVHISFLDPFNERDLVERLAAAKVSAICMEMIPRTTIAQKMDALSSQSSLTGYHAVILAADELDRIFPMMMTPAGTIQPARVFVIGVGVAGLQAIATAKRLGARFVKIDLGETGQTEQGYAKALTDEQLAIQQEAMAKHCAMADVVITTAQVFGKKAPIIVTTEMVRHMKPGSIVIDLAVETGGNVECVEPGKVVMLKTAPVGVPPHGFTRDHPPRPMRKQDPASM